VGGVDVVVDGAVGDLDRQARVASTRTSPAP
jgi:hypothetical protein